MRWTGRSGEASTATEFPVKRSRRRAGGKMGQSSFGGKRSAREYRPWPLKGGASTRWATTAARTWFSASMPPRVRKSGDTPIRSRSIPRQFEGGPAGTPSIDGDRVYTLSHEGDLFCLAASNGKVLWRKNLLRDFGGSRQRWGYAGSPLVDGNLVIVDSGGVGASTVALDKTTGALKWKAGDDEAGYSSPVAFDLAGTRCIAVFKADALVGLNAANGQEMWRYRWKTSYDINAPTPMVFGDKIFITSGYGTGCALLQVSPGKATQIWRNKNMRSQLGSPVLVRGLHLRHRWQSSAEASCVVSKLRTGR